MVWHEWGRLFLMFFTAGRVLMTEDDKKWPYRGIMYDYGLWEEFWELTKEGNWMRESKEESYLRFYDTDAPKGDYEGSPYWKDSNPKGFALSLSDINLSRYSRLFVEYYYHIRVGARGGRPNSPPPEYVIREDTLTQSLDIESIAGNHSIEISPSFYKRGRGHLGVEGLYWFSGMECSPAIKLRILKNTEMIKEVEHQEEVVSWRGNRNAGPTNDAEIRIHKIWLE